MTYKDKYKMIKEMILSDDDEIKKRAWDMLNLNHGDWVWMRANLIVDCWQAADAKGREKFILMNLKHHVESGSIKQIEDSTEEDGIICKQYLYPNGKIYKVPTATDKMDKYAYESLVNKYNEDFDTK
jgi:hypothetical protein